MKLSHSKWRQFFSNAKERAELPMMTSSREQPSFHEVTVEGRSLSTSSSISSPRTSVDMPSVDLLDVFSGPT